MPPETPHRILVVDDEPDITALVAYHLAKEGYRVTTPGTGSDALRSARPRRARPHAAGTLRIRSPGRAAAPRGDARRRRAATDGTQGRARPHQRLLTRCRGLPAQAVLAERAGPARGRDPAAPRGAPRRRRRPAGQRPDRPGSHGASRHRRR